MIALLRWFFRWLDRRPSPIGNIARPHLLGLHINEATKHAIVADPRLTIRH